MAGLPSNAPATTALVNATYVFKVGDDTKTGKLTLQKSSSDPTKVNDPQVFLNEIADTQGTSEGDPNRKNYANENFIANDDSQKTCIEKIDAQLKVNRDDIDSNDVDISRNKRTTYANEEIDNLGTVSKDNNILTQVRRVSGLAGPQTAANAPFGDCSGMADGTVIILRGTHAVNFLKILHQDIQYGCILNGDAELELYFEIEIMYDSILERFIEQRRNF